MTRRHRAGCRRVFATPGWRRSRAGEPAVVTLAAGVGSRWTQGAGVVKALHPFCKFGRHATAPSWKCTSPKAGASAAMTGVAAAACYHHQLSDPRADRGVPARGRTITAIPARCCSRPDGPSACAWSRWSATCDFCGRKCPSNFSTNRRKRCATACAPPYRVGPAGRRRQRLHRQRSLAMPASRRPLVRNSQPAAQRRPAAPVGGTPALEIPAGCTTSIPWAPISIPRCSGCTSEQGAVPVLRSDHSPLGRPRRRPGPRQWPRPPRRRPGHAARRG